MNELIRGWAFRGVFALASLPLIVVVLKVGVERFLSPETTDVSCLRRLLHQQRVARIPKRIGAGLLDQEGHGREEIGRPVGVVIKGANGDSRLSRIRWFWRYR